MGEKNKEENNKRSLVPAAVCLQVHSSNRVLLLCHVSG